MASTNSDAATRRRGPAKSTTKGDEPEVSPARWAGVALVIAAIVGAILLAVMSPSDPDTTRPAQIGAGASPTPGPTVLDSRVPTSQPTITSPAAGETGETDLPFTVDLPDEEVPNKLLTLVILGGEKPVELPRPKTGGEVTVGSVRLNPGENVLTAVLEGPGGRGPVSEEVVKTLVTEKPSLTITSPKTKAKTYDSVVRVEGISEVGAEVRVRNGANTFDQSIAVPASGEFAITVPLKRGVVNRIKATSTSSLGLATDARVDVTRLNGNPTVKITAPPSVKESSLPTNINIVVKVTDDTGRKLEGADVAYTLSGRDRSGLSESDVTNANGRSTWNPRIERSNSIADTLLVSATVTNPVSGDETTESVVIEVK